MKKRKRGREETGRKAEMIKRQKRGKEEKWTERGREEK